MLYGADLGRAAFEAAASPTPQPNTRAADKLPPIDALRKMFAYNPHNGALINRYTRSYKAQAGEPAGYINKKDGHRYVSISGYTHVLVSRIAWALYYGEWPKGVVDHIDRNPANDRIKNLRDTTQTVNMRNRGLAPNNSTGHRGIGWHKQRQKWRARIDGVHLGLFDTLEEAVEARRQAEVAQWGKQ